MIFKGFLYILLEPKNKIDILITLAALFHEFVLMIPYMAFFIWLTTSFVELQGW